MIWYVILFIMITIIVSEWAFYKVAGYLDLSIFFKPEILSWLGLIYRKEIGIYGIFVVLMFLAIYFYQEYKIKSRKNCVVQEVDLKEIAKIWLEAEDYKKAIEEAIKKELPRENKKEVQIIISSFKEDRSKKLFEFINEKSEYFSDLGIKIAKDLIEILENNPAKSVASLYKGDTNFKDYKKLVVGDKTSYDVLSEVSLYTHSMNVVEEIIEIVEGKEEANLYYEKAIIAALAHDIGKLRALQEYSEKITADLFKNAPHNVISALFLREKYPEYKKDVIEAIEFHHGPIKPKNYVLMMLKEADKRAREKEIEKWLLENKEKEEGETIKKNDFSNKEDYQEESPQEELKEAEELFEEIDIEDIFEDAEETVELKELVKEDPCQVEYTPRGLNLENLIFIKNSKLYLSPILAKKVGIKEKANTYYVKTKKGEYSLLLIELNPDWLGDMDCEEIEEVTREENDG